METSNHGETSPNIITIRIDGEDPLEGKPGLILQAALDGLGWELRLNLRRMNVEVCRDGVAWEPLVDHAYDKFKMDLNEQVILEKGEKEKPFNLTKDDFSSAVSAIAVEHQFDPIAEVLEQAEKGFEKPDLNFLGEYLGDLFHLKTEYAGLSEDETKAYHAAVGTVIFLGMVARTLKPGSRFHFLPVFLGPRSGEGKSSFCEALVPEAEYSGNIDFRAETKEKVEALQGKWVVENPELRGMTRKQVESIKAFLTQSHDSIRLAYRRDPVDFPRRCIIIATGNPVDSIPDDGTTGRRFLPVEVGAAKDLPAELSTGDLMSGYMSAYRDELFASAIKLFREGYEPAFPLWVERLAGRVVTNYLRVDENMLEAVVKIKQYMIDDDDPPYNHKLPDDQGVVGCYTQTQLLKIAREKQWIDTDRNGDNERFLKAELMKASHGLERTGRCKKKKLDGGGHSTTSFYYFAGQAEDNLSDLRVIEQAKEQDQIDYASLQAFVHTGDVRHLLKKSQDNRPTHEYILGLRNRGGKDGK